MPNIHSLIDFFANFTVLPIDPDDVRDQILEYGVKDEIEFVGVTLDERIIIGAFHQYIRSPGVYADPIVCADIYYDRSQERKWRRVICCKELLHLLERSHRKTATQEECERLLDDLVQINGPKSKFSPEAMQAWEDHLTLYYAVAILFPIGARDILHPYFVSGSLSIEKISQDADLPESVVALVMSDRWPDLHSILLGSK
jgi:hypothetical protein